MGDRRLKGQQTGGNLHPGIGFVQARHCSREHEPALGEWCMCLGVVAFVYGGLVGAHCVCGMGMRVLHGPLGAILMHVQRGTNQWRSMPYMWEWAA